MELSEILAHPWRHLLPSPSPPRRRHHGRSSLLSPAPLNCPSTIPTVCPIRLVRSAILYLAGVGEDKRARQNLRKQIQKKEERERERERERRGGLLGAYLQPHPAWLCVGEAVGRRRRSQELVGHERREDVTGEMLARERGAGTMRGG